MHELPPVARPVFRDDSFTNMAKYFGYADVREFISDWNKLSYYEKQEMRNGVVRDHRS